jgi:hypothetical protein
MGGVLAGGRVIKLTAVIAVLVLTLPASLHSGTHKFAAFPPLLLFQLLFRLLLAPDLDPFRGLLGCLRLLREHQRVEVCLLLLRSPGRSCLLDRLPGGLISHLAAVVAGEFDLQVVNVTVH